MRRGTKKFKALKLAQSFWKHACNYDNIPAGSSFVVFSNDNPFIRLQSKALNIMYNNM